MLSVAPLKQFLLICGSKKLYDSPWSEFFSPISERFEVVRTTFGVKYRIGLLAWSGCQRGGEAWGRTRSSVRAGRGRGCETPLGQICHSVTAREFCHVGKLCAWLPCPCDWWQILGSSEGSLGCGIHRPLRIFFGLYRSQIQRKRCFIRVNLPHSERPLNTRQGLACTTSTLNYAVYWCPYVVYTWWFYYRTVSPTSCMCFTEIHV